MSEAVLAYLAEAGDVTRPTADAPVVLHRWDVIPDTGRRTPYRVELTMKLGPLPNRLAATGWHLPNAASKVDQVMAIWATMTPRERRDCRAVQMTQEAVAQAITQMKLWEAASADHRTLADNSYGDKRRAAIQQLPSYIAVDRKRALALLDQVLADAGEVEDLTQIKNTALHEAGHALACASFGVEIKVVEVKDRVRTYGFVRHAATLQEEMQRSADYFMQSGIILAAGPMAENPDIRTYADFRAYCTAKDNLGGSDFTGFNKDAHGAVLVHRSDNVEAFREKAIAATRALLDLPASKVFLARMTDALVERRRLNGRDVMEIYEGASGTSEAERAWAREQLGIDRKAA